MNIIFCYAGEPHPLAAAAISRFAPEAEAIDTKGLFGYNDAIASHWTGEDDLLVVEGDKEINAEVIPSLSSCSEPWCVYSYWNYPKPYRKKEIYGLGCTKYSAQVQRGVSVDEFCGPDPSWVKPCDLCNGEGCWKRLDVRIAMQVLNKSLSFAPHIHGMINHHHTYSPDWVMS